MSSVTEFQQIAWTVYTNLRGDLSDPSLEEFQAENSLDLLRQLLRHEDFEFAVKTAAEQIEGPDQAGYTIADIDRQTSVAYSSYPDATTQTADYLVESMQQGNIAVLANLAEGFKPHDLFVTDVDQAKSIVSSMQADDKDFSANDFSQQFSRINPAFEGFFRTVKSSSGGFLGLGRSHLEADLMDGLNDPSSTLAQSLIDIGQNEAAMDVLLAQSVGHLDDDQGLSKVINAAISAIPPKETPTSTAETAPITLTSAFSNPASVGLRKLIDVEAALREEADAVRAEKEDIAKALSDEDRVMEQQVIAEKAPAVALTQEEINAQIAAMPRSELLETLATAHDNGGASYETYKASFIALNPDYQQFFDGLEGQAGALGINSAQELLVGALNNPDSSVLDHMVLYADDPEQLQALTVMVEDSGFMADERQMSDLIHSLARENGLDVHATSNMGATPTPEVLEDGQVVNPEVETFSATVQTEVQTLRDAPQGIIADADSVFPDTIPEENIITVTPRGLEAPAIPELDFQIPSAPAPVPPTTEHFIGVAANVDAAPTPETSPALDVYVVQGIDGKAGLWGIAQREMGLTDYQDIISFTDHVAKLNGLDNPDLIHPDQSLVLPTAEMIENNAETFYDGKDIGQIRQTALDAANPSLVESSLRPQARPDAPAGGARGYLQDSRIAAARFDM